MRRGQILSVLILLIAIALVLGWWLTRSPVAGPLTLARVNFSDLPGWSAGDPKRALQAFQRSCTARVQDGDGLKLAYAGTAADWREVCAAAQRADTNAARAFFAQWFQPIAISAGRVEDGLFTGYYEPQLRGSRLHRGAYQTPVYGLPRDLISVDLGQFREALKGEHIAGRIVERRLVPYDTRARIDAKGLKQAPILFYGDDPAAVFFLHIQGSGRVQFDDGSWARVAYAGENGHPYTAIGKTLVAQGALQKGKVSMQTIRAWLI